MFVFCSECITTGVTITASRPLHLLFSQTKEKGLFWKLFIFHPKLLLPPLKIHTLFPWNIHLGCHLQHFHLPALSTSPWVIYFQFCFEFTASSQKISLWIWYQKKKQKHQKTKNHQQPSLPWVNTGKEIALPLLSLDTKASQPRTREL